MQSYKRSERVSELILQELSQIVHDLKEPGLGFVTVTAVKLSDDLQHAKVFYSVIGSEEDRKRSMEIINESRGFIRQQLAGRLTLRRAPELAFEYDTTPEKADRIFELLEKIRAEQPAGGEEKPGGEETGEKTGEEEKKK